MTRLLLLGFFSVLSACSDRPSVDDAESALRSRIDKGSAERIKLTHFRKLDGQSSEMAGISLYRMAFEAGLEFMDDVLYVGTGSSLLDDTYGGDGRITSEPLTQPLPSCATNLYYCINPLPDVGHKGGAVNLTGTVGFEKSESGWHVTTLSFRKVADAEASATRAPSSGRNAQAGVSNSSVPPAASVAPAGSAPGQRPASVDDELLKHLRCCDEKDLRVVEQLLARGANPNINDDYNATSALGFAIDADRGDIARLLMSKGANVNAMSSGDPQHPEVFRSRSLAMIELLVGQGADVMAKGSDNRTLLHMHASGDPAIVSYLLAKGLDVNARDAWGKTPLARANEEGEYLDKAKSDSLTKRAIGYDDRLKRNRAVIQLLEKAGGRI